MEFFGFITVTCTGRVGDGVITATGVKVGDIILKAWGTTGTENLTNLSSGFRVVVENDDEIYQRGLSDSTEYDPLVFLLLRGP